MLALGADFVLMGRPFMYAVAALGKKGGDHVMDVFKAELRAVMGQLGCPTLADLPEFLQGFRKIRRSDPSTQYRTTNT